jgi:hypothetical protein
MDYSRFDNIDTDSDEETPPSTMNERLDGPMKANNMNVNPTKIITAEKNGRIAFQHKGNIIYEWEQSMEEVNIYIKPPPGISSSIIQIGEHYFLTFVHIHIFSSCFF